MRIMFRLQVSNENLHDGATIPLSRLEAQDRRLRFRTSSVPMCFIVIIKYIHVIIKGNTDSQMEFLMDDKLFSDKFMI